MSRHVLYKINDDDEVVEQGFAEVSKDLSLYNAEDMTDLAFDVAYQFLIGDKSMVECTYSIELTHASSGDTIGSWAFSVPESFSDHVAPTFYNYAPGSLH